MAKVELTVTLDGELQDKVEFEVEGLRDYQATVGVALSTLNYQLELELEPDRR